MQYSDVLLELFTNSAKEDAKPARELRKLAEEIRLQTFGGKQVLAAIARASKCEPSQLDVEKVRQHCLEAARRLEGGTNA